MAKLIYSAIMSLDGYTVDANGSFDWAAPTATCTHSSMTFSAVSAPTSADAGCTRR